MTFVGILFSSLFAYFVIFKNPFSSNSSSQDKILSQQQQQPGEVKLQQSSQDPK